MKPNFQAINQAIRSTGRHEGSWAVPPRVIPRVRDYADAISTLISDKCPGFLRRAARRFLEYVVPIDRTEAKTASEWLAQRVQGWNLAKLKRAFRRTSVRITQGYAPVPDRFFPVDAVTRLKCFVVLSDELVRRSRIAGSVRAAALLQRLESTRIRRLEAQAAGRAVAKTG